MLYTSCTNFWIGQLFLGYWKCLFWISYWHPLIIFMNALHVYLQFYPSWHPHKSWLAAREERTRTINTDERLSSSFHLSLNSLNELTTSTNLHGIRIKLEKKSINFHGNIRFTRNVNLVRLWLNKITWNLYVVIILRVN